MTGKYPIFLVLIWLLQSALVLLLAYWNPNHFTTVDSGYYLQSASQLLRGEGHSYLENGRTVWNSIFPLGYPAAIAGVALVSGLPVLWASKLVNLLASAVFLYLLHRWFGDRKAVQGGVVLLLGQFVKLWAHTWSEPLFLVLLFAWAYLFFKRSYRYYLVFVVGLALMLVRYAGVCIIPLALVLAVIQFRRFQRPQARVSFWLAVGWLFAIGNYFNYNLYKSGEWYGGERFSETPAFGSSLLLFGRGLLNELFLFRDTDFSGPDPLFMIGLVLQVALILLLFVTRTGFRSLSPLYPVRFAWYTALSYLIFFFIVRMLSPFDAPGYRLLAPFSFLVFWEILYRVKEITLAGNRALLGWAVLFTSWLHLLPQQNIAGKLGPLWHWAGMP
jgi:hypothetical protein